MLLIIQRSKSEVALESMKRINSCTKVVAHDAKVGPSTENHFSASFFDSLDVVCNALDNFDARYYIDRRCTVAKKPLIDPGTEGMALSLKVIIPWVTNTFSDQVPQERQEKSIPICTLRSFPTKSEHTLMWAKDRFALHFTKRLAVLILIQCACRTKLLSTVQAPCNLISVARRYSRQMPRYPTIELQLY